jgi:hypothetical protein
VREGLAEAATGFTGKEHMASVPVRYADMHNTDASANTRWQAAHTGLELGIGVSGVTDALLRVTASLYRRRAMRAMLCSTCTLVHRRARVEGGSRTADRRLAMPHSWASSGWDDPAYKAIPTPTSVMLQLEHMGWVGAHTNLNAMRPIPTHSQMQGAMLDSKSWAELHTFGRRARPPGPQRPPPPRQA